MLSFDFDKVVSLVSKGQIENCIHENKEIIADVFVDCQIN
jgi:hypothetical protein